MIIGYVRVSSLDQNEERQVQKMKELGIEDRFIFIDKQSGKNFDRPMFQAMLNVLREGDTLYLDSLDRLGRDYDGIIQMWQKITREIKADIIVLENEGLFNSQIYREMGDMGKLLETQFLSLLSYVAAEERKKIRRRQEEGIAIYLKKGGKFGRKPIEIDEAEFQTICDMWKAGEITAVEAIKRSGLSKATFYRRVKREHS